MTDDTFFMALDDPTSAIDAEGVNHDLSASFDSDSPFYSPPIDLKKLAVLRRVNAQHGALPSFRADWVVKYLKPNALIPVDELRKAIIDHQSLGNGYLQLVTNRVGGVIAVKQKQAINMRRGRKNTDQYYWLTSEDKYKSFKAHEVVHFMEYDCIQEVYGVPFWLGALQSILLSEDVRLFPRKFFRNGAHAGNMIVTAGLDENERKVLNEKMKGTTRLGNFRSAIVNFLKSGLDLDKALKVINFGADAAKIDYTKIAKMCETDVLEAWRTHPALAGMTPENTVSIGDLDKIVRMYHENEIVPLQQYFKTRLNAVLPAAYHIDFYSFEAYESLKNK